MPTSTTVNDLKINKLTSAQYDAAVQGGVIGENELSIITDLDEAIQVSSLPTAGASESGKIYQYIGATDANYTNGYFYKCVSDGQSPATYSWEAVAVQEVDALPDQTGQSGKFLTTDGSTASWSDKPLVNNTTSASSLVISNTANTSTARSVIIGREASTTGTWNVAIGPMAVIDGSDSTLVGVGTIKKTAKNSVGIGNFSHIGADHPSTYSDNRGSYTISIASKIGMNVSLEAEHAIFLGATNDFSQIENESFYVGFSEASNNKTFKLLDSTGTIPEARLADTTSATTGQVLQLDSNGNAIWGNVDPLPSQTGNAGKVLTTDGTTASWVDISTSPSTMPQLLAANWSSNTQTVSVTGVTANNVVMVSPSPVSATEYAQCGILCTAQAAGTLTFTCTSVPTNDLTVNVVCF